jgi:hypothetical protein
MPILMAPRALASRESEDSRKGRAGLMQTEMRRPLRRRVAGWKQPGVAYAPSHPEDPTGELMCYDIIEQDFE